MRMISKTFDVDAGGLVLLSMHAPNGILFEYFNGNMENPWTLSTEQYVDSWNRGTTYDSQPGTDAVA